MFGNCAVKVTSRLNSLSQQETDGTKDALQIITFESLLLVSPVIILINQTKLKNMRISLHTKLCLVKFTEHIGLLLF